MCELSWRWLPVGIVFAGACAPGETLYLPPPSTTSGAKSFLVTLATERAPEVYAMDAEGRLALPLDPSSNEPLISAAGLPRTLSTYGFSAGLVQSARPGVPLAQEAVEFLEVPAGDIAGGWRPALEIPDELASFSLPSVLRCPRLVVEHEETLDDFSHSITTSADGSALLVGSGSSIFVVTNGRPDRRIRVDDGISGLARSEDDELHLLMERGEVRRLDLETETTTVTIRFDLGGALGYRWPSAVGRGDEIQLFAVNPGGSFASIDAGGSRELGRLAVTGKQVNHCGTLAVSPTEILAVCATDARVHAFRDGALSAEVPEGLPPNTPGFPTLIRAVHGGAESEVYAVNEYGYLFELDGLRWRALPPSGIKNVTAAIGYQAGFVLGTSAGLVTYFEPGLGVECPFVGTSNLTEVFDMEPHGGGVLVVGRSRLGRAGWAFIAPSED